MPRKPFLPPDPPRKQPTPDPAHGKFGGSARAKRLRAQPDPPGLLHFKGIIPPQWLGEGSPTFTARGKPVDESAVRPHPVVPDLDDAPEQPVSGAPEQDNSSTTAPRAGDAHAGDAHAGDPHAPDAQAADSQTGDLRPVDPRALLPEDSLSRALYPRERKTIWEQYSQPLSWSFADLNHVSVNDNFEIHDPIPPPKTCDHDTPYDLCWYCNGNIPWRDRAKHNFVFYYTFPVAPEELFIHPEDVPPSLLSNKNFMAMAAVYRYAPPEHRPAQPHRGGYVQARHACNGYCCPYQLPAKTLDAPTYIPMYQTPERHEPYINPVLAIQEPRHGAKRYYLCRSITMTKKRIPYNPDDPLHQELHAFHKREIADVVRQEMEWFIKLMATRPYSSYEVSRKLAYRLKKYKNQLEDDEVKDVFDKVMAFAYQERYIDDKKFARLWVMARGVNGSLGVRRLRQELQNKHIEPAFIDEAMAQMEQESGFHKAMALLSKRPVDNKASRGRNRQRLSDYLMRRGYDYDVISRAVDEYFRQLDDQAKGIYYPDDDEYS